MPPNSDVELPFRPSRLLAQVKALRSQVRDIDTALSDIEKALKRKREPTYNPEQGIGRPTPKVVTKRGKT